MQRPSRPVLAAVLAAVLVATAGCGPRTGDPAGPRTFPVQGVVVELGDTPGDARIRHEEIPGYMKAMTMSFSARPTNALDGLKPGDRIAFTLVDTGNDGWIEGVSRIGEGESITPDLRPPAPSTARLEIGQTVPDCVLTNQLGQTESLAGLRGQAVALTFIFTTCPFPTFCPKMSDHFAEVQKTLLADPSAPKNWKLWSVTMDPATDTPAVLSDYGRRYAQQPAHWSLLTGPLDEVSHLGDRFGLTFWRANGTISHNLRTVVIDAAGRVQAILPENKWTPAELADQIRRAAAAPVP